MGDVPIKTDLRGLNPPILFPLFAVLLLHEPYQQILFGIDFWTIRIRGVVSALGWIVPDHILSQNLLELLMRWNPLRVYPSFLGYIFFQLDNLEFPVWAV
jgi:hypothetical protein